MKIILIILILLPALLFAFGCSDDGPTEPAVEQADVLLLKDAHFPSWSPDGMEIICNRSLPGLRLCAWEITRVGGRSDTLFVDTGLKYGPMFPKWMPDGVNVIYFGHTLDEVHKYFMIRNVVQENMGEDDPVRPPIRIIEIDGLWDDAGFTLTPDGSEVLYTTWREGSGHVVLALNLNDESTRLIGTGDQAAVSPDGQWIAISSEASLAIVPAGGGEKFALEPGWWPTWTPDSQYIIFSGLGQESGNSELVLISRDGTYREELTNDPEVDLCPAMSPLGGELVYVKTPDHDVGPFQVRRLKLKTPSHAGS